VCGSDPSRDPDNATPDGYRPQAEPYGAIIPIGAQPGDSRPGSVGSGRRPSPEATPSALDGFRPTPDNRKRDEPSWSIGRLLRVGAPVRAGPQARARRGQRRAAERSGAALILGRRNSAGQRLSVRVGHCRSQCACAGAPRSAVPMTVQSQASSEPVWMTRLSLRTVIVRSGRAMPSALMIGFAGWSLVL
jgi:hypothetical protein